MGEIRQIKMGSRWWAALAITLTLLLCFVSAEGDSATDVGPGRELLGRRTNSPTNSPTQTPTNSPTQTPTKSGAEMVQLVKELIHNSAHGRCKPSTTCIWPYYQNRITNERVCGWVAHQHDHGRKVLKKLYRSGFLQVYTEKHGYTEENWVNQKKYDHPVYVCLVEFHTDQKTNYFKDAPRIKLKDSNIKTSRDAKKDMIGKFTRFEVDGTYRKVVICESLPEKLNPEGQSLRSCKKYQEYPKTGLVSICSAAKVAVAEDVKVQLRNFKVYDDAGGKSIDMDCLHSTVYKVGDTVDKRVLSVAHVKHIGLMREVCKGYTHAQATMPTWNSDSGVIDKQLAAAEQMTIAQM